MSADGNPWLAVPSQPPYLLPCDSDKISKFNAKHPDGKYRVQDNVLPEPFIGSTKAPVVLLSLNPGFANRNITEHGQPAFQAMLRRNYAQHASAFPFYYLDPSCQGGGRLWWERILKPLLKLFERKQVAQSLLCVEYFPYHSGSFHQVGLHLPSQQYGFGLVRSAIDREAVVVIMRARKLWVRAVPQLKKNSAVFTFNSSQNVVLSPRNCAGFEVVASAMRTTKE